MFVLRVIREEREDEKKPFYSRVMNHFLGDYYEFCKAPDGEQFGMVLGEKDTKVIKLYKNRENVKYAYFIMTGIGSTFEKIVNRG